MTRTPALMVALLATFGSTACDNDSRDTVMGEGEARLERAAAIAQSAPRTAGPPKIVPDGDATRTTGHAHVMDLAEAERLVDAFDLARTSRGLDHLAASALAILAGSRDPMAPSIRRRLYATYNRVALGVKPVFTIGYEGAGECDVDFDSPSILDGFIDDAQSTFSTPPHWVQQCGQAEVRVEPTVYSHYHLNYEDPTIDCIDTATGLFGRGDITDCDPLDDATLEPRYLGSHTGQEVIRIRLVAGGASQPFRVHSFANIGDEAVRFRYRKGGVWYEWASLGGHTIWNVAAYVVGATEVRITNAGTSLSCGIDWVAAWPGGCPVDPTPFFLDDFSISP